MTDVEVRTDAQGPASIKWLSDLLWAGDVETAISTDGHGQLQFFAHPSRRQPELLVPTSPRQATATLAGRTSDARDWRARWRGLALEAAGSVGMAPFLAARRVLNLEIGEGRDDPERAFPAFVAERLNMDDIVFAVTMGGDRYNRKPVLTVFDPEGRLVAFVKLGADELTNAYVANEARWLSAIEAADGRGFEAPRMRWSGHWRGHAVLVSSPLITSRIPVRRPLDSPPPGLVDAIAGVESRSAVSVAESVVVADAARCGDARLEAARTRTLERHGGVEVHVGAWHGDLSPWNMWTRRRRVPLIWDWEAADAGRPIGADAVHCQVMVSTHLRGIAPAVAVDGLSADCLVEHQDTAEAQAAALDLYLLDVARRDLEIIALGVDPALLPGIGVAALDRLEGR